MWYFFFADPWGRWEGRGEDTNCCSAELLCLSRLLSSPLPSPHLTVVRLRGSSVPPPNLPPTSTSTSTVTGTGTYLGTSRDIWGHRPPTTKLDWFNKSGDSKVNSKYSPAGGQKSLLVSTVNWDQRVSTVPSNPRLGDRWRRAFNKENPYCVFSIFIAISLLWWIIKGE